MLRAVRAARQVHIDADVGREMSVVVGEGVSSLVSRMRFQVVISSYPSALIVTKTDDVVQLIRRGQNSGTDVQITTSRVYALIGSRTRTAGYPTFSVPPTMTRWTKDGVRKGRLRTS